MRSLAVVAGICILASVATASSGDRSQEFQDCVRFCELERCSPRNEVALPLPLRLTLWTCLDDCKYTCMHSLTSLAEQNLGRIHQYYGKWPFWRLAGMQEPASVLFSALNLWAHVEGYKSIRRRVPDWHPMKKLYLYWSVIGMNAWLWSMIFHTRDTPTTERLDYFSAALAILSALHFTVTRFFFLSPSSDRPTLTKSPAQSTGSSLWAYNIWATLCCVVYLAHVAYLSLLPRFDYTYNIIFNLVLGLTHNLLWALYSLPARLTVLRRFPSLTVPRNHRPPFAGKAALCVALTTAATALELFDFPPWGRVLDAHALWHLATAPIALLWYSFLVEDAQDEGWRSGRI